jgi:hypothetical protein
MQKKIILLLFTLVVAFMFCGASSAATVKTNNINTVKISNVGTSTVYDQNNPAIDGSRVVWEQKDPSNHTLIYVKNLDTNVYGPVQLSKQNQTHPDISGTRVVWEQNGNIYLKNLATGKYGKISPSTRSQFNPHISGTGIIWRQEITSHFYAIFVKNLAKGTIARVLTSKQNQWESGISGSIVIWQQHDKTNGKYIIYAKNFATKKIIKVASSTNIQNIDIDKTRIVWTQKNAHLPFTIYVKNIATGASGMVAPTQDIQTHPSISGSLIVWQRDDPCGKWVIYIHNLLTKSSTTVSFITPGDIRYEHPIQDQSMPMISGLRVVWVENQNNHNVIYEKNNVTDTFWTNKAHKLTP